MLVAAGVCGCFPGNDNHQDEERDPHFQRGRDLVNSQEFKAAAEEFEKALETNPRSAAAHFELGCLYDNNLKDYAAAIYHYERLLLLLPASPRAPLVRERIRGCKLELAGTEFPLPNSQNLQREVYALTEENRLLKRQLDEARNHPGAGLAPLPAPGAAPAQPIRALADNPIPNPNLNLNPNPAPSANPPSPIRNPQSTEAAHPRTYVIQAKDSIYSVAARYGLKPSAVLAANPNISPTHLRIGQNLNLP
jgi:LysM repeat protein